jgi:hypothetical protein
MKSRRELLQQGLRVVEIGDRDRTGQGHEQGEVL